MTSGLYKRNQARLSAQVGWDNKRKQRQKAKRDEWISELVYLALVIIGVIVILSL